MSRKEEILKLLKIKKLASRSGINCWGRLINPNSRGFAVYIVLSNWKLSYLAQKESVLHKDKIISGPLSKTSDRAVSLATVCMEAIDKMRDISIRDQFKTQTI